MKIDNEWLQVGHNKKDAKKIRDMLRLIPNGVSVCLEDLLEIFSQEDDTR